MLPAIADAVGDRAEVLLDTGILHGGDVVAALALGARACLVGRAFLYGLMAGGECGVQRAITILAEEVARTLRLLGVASVRDLNRSHASLRPPGDELNRRGRPMQVVEFRPEPEQYAFTFGGVGPVRKVTPGTVLRLWTEDAFCGNIRRTTDLPSAALTMPFVNPQTGPFYVEGAEAGDTLALHFLDLSPAREWGASSTIPFFGGLTSTDRTATLQDPLPERTWIYEVDRDRRTVAFQAQRRRAAAGAADGSHARHRRGWRRPPARCARSLVPDTFGGNMDTPEMRAGATCYLGVNVEGALFSVGDGHYRQGEGEACGTAVEGAMDVTLIVDLIKGGAPGLAADRERRLPDGGGVEPPARGCLAGRPGQHGDVAQRAVRAGQAGRLPAAVADQRGPAGQRRGRQLQLGHEGGQGPAAPGGRLPRHAPAAARGRRGGRPVDGRRQMDLGLQGLRALVTGGTRGIGRAIVETFLAEGASVGFCARTADDVAAAAEALTGRGGQVTGHAIDVADEEGMRRWVTESADRLGGLDIVVANVSALAIPDEAENWRASFNVDMMGTVGLVNAAMPYLKRSQAASIVTIGSVSGREIDFAAGPYGTFKAAIIHYTQGLAYQLAGEGIRANSLSPGNTYFDGGVWQSIEQNNPDLFASALALNPTGRMAKPEEIARAAVFLASPAASFITGANLLVDGALTRGVQF